MFFFARNSLKRDAYVEQLNTTIVRFELTYTFPGFNQPTSNRLAIFHTPSNINLHVSGLHELYVASVIEPGFPQKKRRWFWPSNSANATENYKVKKSASVGVFVKKLPIDQVRTINFD